MNKPALSLVSAFLGIFILLNAGCFKRPLYQPIRKAESIAEKPAKKADLSTLDFTATDDRITTDARRLASYSAALRDMAAEMGELRKGSQVYSKDYFEPQEHDRIESLLFRYLMCRRSLWEMVHYYIDYRNHFTDPVLQTKGFLVGFSSGLHVFYYSSLMVAAFLKEPAGKAKINEAYPKSEIPRGTYDMLYQQVTSIENLKAIKVAWELFSRETGDSNSVLAGICREDSQFNAMVNDIRKLHEESEERIEYVLREDALLLPDVTNRLRHSVIVDLANGAMAKLGDNLYAIQSIIFTMAGDLKSPTVKALKFTAEERKTIKSLIKPGDIILTFSAGYMSNIFLPGNFKHGLLYVGPLKERREFGLTEENVRPLKILNMDRVIRQISVERLPRGYDIDVIEAVSEGVIFNSLDLLLEGHFNRVVIFRPLLTPQEKVEAMANAFALVESGYDFKFDFNDGSYQCCTEVLYRILNAKGPYQFSLVKRAGAFTLSADDIVGYFMTVNPKPFEFVLFADKDTESKDNLAKLHTGTDGEDYFVKFIKGDLKK